VDHDNDQNFPAQAPRTVPGRHPVPESLITVFGFLLLFGAFRGASDRSEQMSGLLGNPLGPLAVMVRLGLIL
jgi:hypothetical protein